jgi:hypothetical protein
MATRISRETFAAIESDWLDILDAIADGQTIADVVELKPYSRSSVYAFRRESTQDVRNAFHDAVKESAQADMDTLRATISSEDLDPRHARNRINGLMWLIEKKDPDRYGQRVRADFNVKTLDLNRIIADANDRLALHQASTIEGVAIVVPELASLM